MYFLQIFNPIYVRVDKKKKDNIYSLYLNKFLISTLEKLLYNCELFLMGKGTKYLLHYLLNIMKAE